MDIRILTKKGQPCVRGLASERCLRPRSLDWRVLSIAYEGGSIGPNRRVHWARSPKRVTASAPPNHAFREVERLWLSHTLHQRNPLSRSSIQGERNVRSSADVSES